MAHEKWKSIFSWSYKRGVGKSVSSYNLAYSLAKLGKKVLAVDFDSQANMSTCFGVEDTATVPITIGHLMMNQIEDEEMPAPEEYIQSRNGVDFIPSSMVPSGVDAKLRLEMGAEKMLSNILELLKDRYDAIIIDTCPALGALTINAIGCSRWCDYHSKSSASGNDGITRFFENCEEDKESN